MPPPPLHQDGRRNDTNTMWGPCPSRRRGGSHSIARCSRSRAAARGSASKASKPIEQGEVEYDLLGAGIVTSDRHHRTHAAVVRIVHVGRSGAVECLHHSLRPRPVAHELRAGEHRVGRQFPGIRGKRVGRIDDHGGAEVQRRDNPMGRLPGQCHEHGVGLVDGFLHGGDSGKAGVLGITGVAHPVGHVVADTGPSRSERPANLPRPDDGDPHGLDLVPLRPPAPR